jgi:hypothetical protein
VAAFAACDPRLVCEVGQLHAPSAAPCREDDEEVVLEQRDDLEVVSGREVGLGVSERDGDVDLAAAQQRERLRRLLLDERERDPLVRVLEHAYRDRHQRRRPGLTAASGSGRLQAFG